MFAVDSLILIGALLLLFAIASSKFSARVGLPGLVVFIGLGMLAGSEGLGGIAFENYVLAQGIGTVALAMILFDGGMRTAHSSFRAALAPSLALATGGVLLTAVLTGVAAAWILGVPLLHGVLLGSIAGSTDAAAVFAVLGGKGVHLRERVASTLEIESGSNDPMAVFLTVAILQILLGDMDPGPGVAAFFVFQMSIGAAVGWLVGRGAVGLNNRINLDAAGLYPVLAAATGLLAYGAAAALGGSGFLSVYLAGIVLGNSRIVFKRGIFLFTDGMAWLAQIVMFTVLGLLAFPSRLLDVAGEGLLIAGALILVARPISVAAMLLPFRFAPKEVLFISWVGLKGAVPIILAIYPFLFGLPEASVLFNVVFFVVLISAVTQGWTMPLLARRLGLEVPTEAEPPVTLEITSLRHVTADIVEYAVGPRSRAAGRAIRDLALPDGAVLAMIARDQEIIAPRGSTKVLPDDHVFLVLRPEVRPLVDRVFSQKLEVQQEPLPAMMFRLLARTTVAELEEFYGIPVEAPPERTLAQLLQERLGDRVRDPGARIVLGAVALRVLDADDGEIESVGLEILSDPP